MFVVYTGYFHYLVVFFLSHQVAKIDITYAKTAKRMDVKKLKTLMWDHLVTPGQVCWLAGLILLLLKSPSRSPFS